MPGQTVGTQLTRDCAPLPPIKINHQGWNGVGHVWHTINTRRFGTAQSHGNIKGQMKKESNTDKP